MTTFLTQAEAASECGVDISALLLQSRNAEICRRYMAGENGYALAREYGLTFQRVYQILHKNLVAIRPHLGAFTPEARAKAAATRLANSWWTPERTERAIAMRKAGKSARAIAAELGTTKDSVIGHLWRHGCKTPVRKKSLPAPKRPRRRRFGTPTGRPFEGACFK